MSTTRERKNKEKASPAQQKNPFQKGGGETKKCRAKCIYIKEKSNQTIPIARLSGTPENISREKKKKENWPGRCRDPQLIMRNGSSSPPRMQGFLYILGYQEKATLGRRRMKRV